MGIPVPGPLPVGRERRGAALLPTVLARLANRCRTHTTLHPHRFARPAQAQLSVAFEPPLAKCMDMPARRVSAGSKSTDRRAASSACKAGLSLQEFGQRVAYVRPTRVAHPPLHIAGRRSRHLSGVESRLPSSRQTNTRHSPPVRPEIGRLSSDLSFVFLGNSRRHLHQCSLTCTTLPGFGGDPPNGILAGYARHRTYVGRASPKVFSRCHRY